MTVRKTVKNPKNETFMRGLKKLMDARPEIASRIAREMADEVIRRAKSYFLTGGPPGERWQELYFAGEEVGQSTPKWWSENKKGADGKGRREKKREDWDPLLDTGALMESIKIFGYSRSETNAKISVGSDSPYAGKHEFGGKNPWGLKDIPARPFMAPALFSVESDPRFQSEIKSRIKSEFKKVLDSAR